MAQLSSTGVSVGPLRASAAATSWCALALVVPTVLVMLFAGNNDLTPAGYWRRNVTLVLSATALAGAMLTLVCSRRLRQQGSTLPLLVAGAAILVLAAVLWNKWYFASYTTSRTADDIFRKALTNLHAPLYGAWPVYHPLGWIIVTFLFAAAFVWIGLRGRWQLLESRALGMGLIAFQVTMTLAIGMADRPIRVYGDFAAYSRYHRDADKFSSVSDLLKNHVQRMPELSSSGQHYPPGMVLMFVIQKQLHCPGLAKLLGLLLPALALLPIGALAMELGLGRRAAGLAQVLFCTSGSVLWYPTISPTPATMLFAATALWLLVRALRRDQMGAALLLGLCMSFFAFFTFASYMVAALMGLFVLLAIATHRIPPLRAIKLVGAALVVFAACLTLLYLVWGFNLVACFRTASARHAVQMGNGFADLRLYLLRGSGSLIAYLIAAGIPLSTLGVSAMVRRLPTEADPLARPFFLATAGAILFAAFNSMAFLETERIWLMFTPALAVLAGHELLRRAQAEGRPAMITPVALALLLACSTVLVFQPHTMMGPKGAKQNRPAANPAPEAPATGPVARCDGTRDFL